MPITFNQSQAVSDYCQNAISMLNKYKPDIRTITVYINRIKRYTSQEINQDNLKKLRTVYGNLSDSITHLTKDHSINEYCARELYLLSTVLHNLVTSLEKQHSASAKPTLKR